MLFHITLFIAFVHHEGHLETTFEAEQGYSTSALVGNSNWEKNGDKTYSEENTGNSRWTPFEGSSLSGEYRSAHCRDGDRLWGERSMEMSAMQENGQGQSALLPELWAALEPSSGFHGIDKSDITEEGNLTQETSLLGRAVGWLEQRRLVQCMARAISQVSQSPLTKERQGQRQSQKQRGDQDETGWQRCQQGGTLVEAPYYASGPSSACKLNCSHNIGERPTSTVNGRPQEDQVRPANGSPRASTIGSSGRYEATDEDAPFSSFATGQLKENVEGAQSSKTAASCAMVQVPGGLPYKMEQLCGKFPGARLRAPAAHRGGQGSGNNQPAEFPRVPDSYRGGCRGKGECHRSQRRGRFDSQPNSSWGSDEDYASQSRDYEESNGCGIAVCQKEKNRWRIAQGWKRWLWWSAAFSTGRQLSTPVIICRGQSCSAWLHNVVLQDDFLSEWGAADKAADLAFEFGYSHAVCGGTLSNGRRASSPKSGLKFDDQVQLFLFNDEIAGQVVMPRKDFESHWEKPWRMHQAPRADFISHDNLAKCCELPHVFDRWCATSSRQPLVRHLQKICMPNDVEGGKDDGSPQTFGNSKTAESGPSKKQLPLGQSFALARTEVEVDDTMQAHLAEHGTLDVRSYGYQHGYLGQRLITLSQDDALQWRRKLRDFGTITIESPLSWCTLLGPHLPASETPSN